MIIALGDCEAVRDGILGQPVNALSSLAYLVAGVPLVGQLRAAPVGQRRWLFAFCLATAANGLGGVAFHGPGGPLSRWVHDTAVLATLGIMAGSDLRALRRRSDAGVGPILIIVGASGAFALVPTISSVAQWLFAAGLAVGELAMFSAGRRRGFGLLAGVGVAAVVVFAASRTGGPWCRPDSLLQGHALWHGLTAVLLWRWGHLALAR